MCDAVTKLLVAEDDDAIASLLDDALTADGYRIALAPDGAAAMQAIETVPGIDLALLDVCMPRVPGIVVAAAALERNIPVVLTSGSLEFAASAERFGIPLLVKPFPFSHLLREVRRTIEETRRNCERARVQRCRLAENVRLLREEGARRS
jgi:DNA-binding NtrC family response regulator